MRVLKPGRLDATLVLMVRVSYERDSILSIRQRRMLDEQHQKDNDAILAIFRKVARDPMKGDVQRVLVATLHNHADLDYDDFVHRRLTRLLPLIRESVRDVDDRHFRTLNPAIHKIGLELHRHGGIRDQRLVYHACNALLYDCKSFNARGELITDVPTEIDRAWNGAGDWTM